MRYVKIWLSLVVIFASVSLITLIGACCGSLARDFASDFLGKIGGDIAFFVVLFFVMTVPATIAVAKIMK